MARPRWQHIVQYVRTARAWGWPITVLLGYRENDGRVLERDRILAVAYQMYEDSICAGCGLPASVRVGDRNMGRFEFHDDAVCHGCESKASLIDDKNRSTFPGQMIYPVDTHA